MNPLREGEQGPDAKGMYWLAVLAAGPVWDIVRGRTHPLWPAVVAVTASVALYLVTATLAFSDRWRAQWLALPVLAVVTIAAAAAFGENWFYLLIMLAVAVGMVVRGRELPVVLLVVVAAGLAIRLSAGSSLSDSLTLVWGIFASGIVPAIIIRLWEAIGELQRTREELARAAVTEERLRFARDLHDLLGHTLSVMVVKAEAVRRLAPRDGETAAGQAADIERIGRQALTEVRGAVTGYRGRGLATELETARTALADAGIAAVLRVPSVRLTPETDALLGWAVREGVTNVIRHSGGANCAIELREADGLVLEIRDDGAAGGSAPGQGGSRGNGLAGLRERVAAAGGTLEAGRLPGRGFLLRVQAPNGREEE
ncbi:sensor histidine kinase [Sphaerimonospora cavernae]|uniref:Sensor histidine kinase n=1 Tax=Sphaerimonospora cavernae TaxID=1740611 RepID=A0ABV6U945_9ACTN